MKKTNCLTFIIVLLAFVILFTDVFADVPAFPGAEGFGATTVGGRGGTVIKVTNTNDSGTGSLRAAVEASGARIVVFTVGGTISLQSALHITNPYLTIAGQTAPGGGICLKDGSSGQTLRIETHDVIVRSLRIRPGPSDQRDGVWINGGYNIIFDHCSVSWGVDENFTASYDAHDITIQWCIISQALRDAGHSKGWHSMGLMFGSYVGDPTDEISAHHNLLAHNLRRNPMIDLDGTLDYVNNVIYNWGDSDWSGYVTNSYNGSTNFVANYVKPGPASNSGKYLVDAVGDKSNTTVYVSGNITHHRTSDNDPETDCIDPNDIDDINISSTRISAPSVTTISAQQAYTKVLENAGAIMPVRDAVDSLVVNSVIDSTNEVIDDPSDAGGWPTLAAGTAPTDTDGDGMPDSWEDDNGLDKNTDDANDNDLDSDYDNIEVYINSLIPNPFDSSASTTTFSLTTNTSGSGSISLDPSGGTYDSSTVVTLTATPVFGYVFSGWSGNLTGSNNPDSITMNSNKSVTATFVEDTTITEFDLTTNTSGSGSITLDPSGGTYDSSTVVTLTANPGSGYQFDSWSGDLSGSANPETITMNANKSVTATFSEVTSTVYDGCSASIVTGSCDTENSGYTGSGYANTDNSTGTYVEWTNVVVSATKNYNCIIRFANGGANSRPVNVSVNDSVQTSLSFESTGNWTTWSTKSCSLYFNSDTNKVKLVGTNSESCPNIDKLEVETGSQTTQFTLTTNTSGSGSISLSPSGGTYDSSTVVILTANPASGYEFDNWSGDLTGSSNPDTIIMNSNKSITANFSVIQYTLTTNTSGSGSISLSPSGGTYDSSTVVTLTANPGTGYQFSSWSGDLTGSANPDSITMNANKSVTATFSQISGGSGEVEIAGSWNNASSHTAESGSNRLLVFTAHAEHNASLTLNGVSYGGKSMTEVIEKSEDSGGFFAVTGLYILKEADIADASDSTFSVTWSTTPIRTPEYSSVFLTGVNQTTPTGDTQSAGGTSSTISTSSLSTSDGDMAILAATCGNLGDYSTGGGFTEALEFTIDDPDGGDGVAGYLAATGASVTPSVTHSNVNRQSLVGIVVQADSSGSSPTQFTLTTNASGTGSVTLDPSGGTYDSSTVVILTANPGTGYEFDNWSGDLTGSSNPDTITMNSNKSVTANFSVIQYTLTTNTSGSGSISLSPSGGTYDSSTVVTLTATADSGYQFDSWSGDLTGSANPDSITMNANKSVTATFSQISGGSGEVEIAGSWTNASSHTAESGSNRLLVFTAHAEHNASLTLDGVSYGGKAMTEVIEKSEDSGGYYAVTGIYILKEDDIADASGSSFSVTWSTTPVRTPEYTSVFLTGVNQTTPIGDTESAGGTSSTISTSSLSTSDGDMAILAATCGNLGDYSTGGGFTEALEITVDDGDGVVGYLSATGASVTPSVTHSNVNRHSLVGIVVQADSSGSSESEMAWQQDSGSDGIVSIEIEHYDSKASQGGNSWDIDSSPPSGATNDTTMQALPNDGDNVNSSIESSSPRLDYIINFVKTGTHYIWVRAYSDSGADNSMHYGLNGSVVSTADSVDFPHSQSAYVWAKRTMGGDGDARINIASTGVDTLNIWMREDGTMLDKIVLTTNSSYTPSGSGPSESSRALSKALVPEEELAEETEVALPTEYSLSHYPNPFNPSTTIVYDLPVQERVELAVFDIMGRRVSVLFDGFQEAGSHKHVWNAVDSNGGALASGVYFCRIRTSSFVKSIKMTYIR